MTHIETSCSAKTRPTTVRLLANPPTMARPNGSIEIRRMDKSPALVWRKATNGMETMRMAARANEIEFSIRMILVEGLKRRLREAKMAHEIGWNKETVGSVVTVNLPIIEKELWHAFRFLQQRTRLETQRVMEDKLRRRRWPKRDQMLNSRCSRRRENGTEEQTSRTGHGSIGAPGPFLRRSDSTRLRQPMGAVEVDRGRK